MSDEYLWNRKGPPDEEVARLEQLLSQFRYKEPRYKEPAKAGHRYTWWLAAAAVLVCGLLLWNRGPLTAWQGADGHRLRAGQLIESGTIESQLTGQVQIEPKSRLRLLESVASRQRFHLERGTIHALIWAPPGRFVVDTPSAKSIDLGCRYTLQVSENGTGLLSVETGWVALEWKKAESFIPAGAVCLTRPKLGPGIPWFADASAALKNAVAEFDISGGSAPVQKAIAEARERDALTLWHLMVRTQGLERGAVYDRLAGLVNLPPTAPREAILAGNTGAIEAAWNALDLGSAAWWREWKQGLPYEK